MFHAKGFMSLLRYGKNQARLGACTRSPTSSLFAAPQVSRTSYNIRARACAVEG